MGKVVRGWLIAIAQAALRRLDPPPGLTEGDQALIQDALRRAAAETGGALPAQEIAHMTAIQTERVNATTALGKLCLDHWPLPSLERVTFGFHFDDGMVVQGEMGREGGPEALAAARDRLRGRP